MTTEAAETAAFTTLGRAMRAKMYHTRRPLLLEAAMLYRGLGNVRDARLADRLTCLAELANYAEFQNAASL